MLNRETTVNGIEPEPTPRPVDDKPEKDDL